MSVSVEGEVSSPLCERQGGFNQTITKTNSGDSLEATTGVVASDSKANGDQEKATPSSPYPMAFTIDFGAGKQVDKSRLEELAKKSKMRHQRVQSMSASLTKPSPTVQIAQKPPMSVKLPRKAQGYNSEGYFSSDQEDSNFSGSVKLRQSPLAQTFDNTHITSPLTNRHFQSPSNVPRKSKSPIVDSIMSRSDILPSRQSLNLPLKGPISSYNSNVHRTPSYNNIASSYQPRSTMADILDCSPEGALLTDISSPELDILTPDNGLSTLQQKSPARSGRRAVSEMPDLVFSPKMMSKEPLYIDDEIDRASNNSSTGTYTIEGDNYTEEQKARMSIDRTFGSSSNTLESKRAPSNEKDPELIYDYPHKLITNEPIRDVILNSPIKDQTFNYPKVSKDKNVLEISCCYEAPTENDLAAQTSKQIKSTRSYLEKIKNRVRTITEKTFAKSPPKQIVPADVGSFTSVTTSGVLSSKYPLKQEFNRRRFSLTKSEIDQTDYVHRLDRESSVPVNLPSKLDGARFESTPLKNAQKCIRDERAASSDRTSDELAIGKLSYMSLNRCKGDKTWIQDWAESVKKYNNNALTEESSNTTFVLEGDRPPVSPRRETQKGSISRNSYSSGGTPTKIPSPGGTLQYRRTPDLIPTNQDTESYLQKTQNVISSLQAKLNTTRINNYTHSPDMSTSVLSDKTLSRLPVAQLSRSNSLNYRLRRKIHSEENSPLRTPNNYTITGSDKVPESTRILLNSASRSLDTDKKVRDTNMNSPVCNNRSYTKHSRHKSFDGRNAQDYFTENIKNANPAVSLRTVLKNNAESVLYPRIDQTRCLSDRLGATIKRSSSFSTVVKNNNYLDKTYQNNLDLDYLSDDSDTLEKSQEIPLRKPLLNRGRIDSPDLKNVPTNSPKCSNTPELQRKFGPGLVRNSVRVTNKERAQNTRLSEPPMVREEKSKNHQSRRISEPTKQAVLNRLTKSRSSTREFQPKNQDKVPGLKKAAQHRSSSALASKEVELSNWKKRSTYDPMRAAAEGRKKQQAAKQARSPPSNSSPVHRSQSFHTTNMADLTLDYSSEETEDDAILNLPIDNVMVSSSHSDNLDVRRTGYRDLRRHAMNNGNVVFNKDYVAGFQVNQPELKSDNRHRREMAEKRRTFILDGSTDQTIDKRRTFIMDSDTASASTANESSARGAGSDSEGDSGPDSAPVLRRQGGKQRHSGEYSVSSSSASVPVQPRYLDISRYRSESGGRRSPLRTEGGARGRAKGAPARGSAAMIEMEQKKQELEKWKRRASYDPRKAAAQGRRAQPAGASNVLRSQSFHGPVLVAASLRYQPTPQQISEDLHVDSDNNF